MNLYAKHNVDEPNGQMDIMPQTLGLNTLYSSKHQREPHIHLGHPPRLYLCSGLELPL